MRKHDKGVNLNFFDELLRHLKGKRIALALLLRQTGSQRKIGIPIKARVTTFAIRYRYKVQ